MRTTTAAIAAALLLLTGCDSGGSRGGDNIAEPSNACEEVFASADVGEGQDSVEDLYPAFDACETVAQFEAAAEKYPDVLDVEPDLYVENSCRNAPAVAESALCAVAG